MLKVLQTGWAPNGDLPPFNANGAGFMGANSHTQYIGGMPVGIATDGLVVGGQANQVETIRGAHTGPVAGQTNFLGLMVNNYQLDYKTGRGLRDLSGVAATDITWCHPSIVLLPCLVELKMGTDDRVADATPPFITTVTWAVRDRLYITDSATAALNGRWTNVASGTNTAPLGVVIKAPASETDTMWAIFYNLPDLVLAG